MFRYLEVRAACLRTQLMKSPGYHRYFQIDKIKTKDIILLNNYLIKLTGFVHDWLFNKSINEKIR